MTTRQQPALTKTLRDGRTATVTIEQHGRTTVSVVRIGDKEIGNHCGGPHAVPLGLPPEYVAAIGRLALTAEEAATVEAAYRAHVAALPRDLRAERDRLANRLRAAHLGAQDEAEDAIDRYDGAGNPFPGREAAEARIRDAHDALRAFDAAHPEIAEQVATEKVAALRRALDN